VSRRDRRVDCRRHVRRRLRANGFRTVHERGPRVNGRRFARVQSRRRVRLAFAFVLPCTSGRRFARSNATRETVRERRPALPARIPSASPLADQMQTVFQVYGYDDPRFYSRSDRWRNDYRLPAVWSVFNGHLNRSGNSTRPRVNRFAATVRFSRF